MNNVISPDLKRITIGGKMVEIITDLASESAFEAHIENFVAFWARYGNAPGSEINDTPELCLFMSGIPHPLFNAVLRAKIVPEALDSTILSVVERFKARHTSGFWWIGPTTQPANLAEALTRHGFVFAGNLPGMALDLHTAKLEQPLPPGLNIVRVEDAQALTTYLYTLARGSDLPMSLSAALLHIERGAVLPPGAELRRYLAFLDNNPVATCAMVLFAGIAGIYAVATVPEARRKGIGSAITTFPLREAHNLGYKVSTLQASEMGFPIYEKIGFRTVCNFALHMWAEH